MSAYCVQLKDESAEHKIYPRTLTHCVVDEDGKTILEVVEDLLGDTSLTFNELLQEANRPTVSPSVFSELISILKETQIYVYYSDSQPARWDLGDLWYNTSENKLYQKTGNSYIERPSIDLRDALKVVNPHFSKPVLVIHIQDRSPAHNLGDLWLKDTIKQSRNDLVLGLGWHPIDDYHYGGSNLLRYTREYDPLSYDKWVDKSKTPVTSEVYQRAQYEFGVQRIEKADASVCQSVKLEPGTYYCMSAYVKSERSDLPATLKGVVDSTYATIETSNFTQGAVIGTEYQRVYFVFRTYSTCTYLMPRFTSNLDRPYLIYGLQLEKGIEPTDWNPNPLDVIERIRECRTICRDSRLMYYKNAPISADSWALSYDSEKSTVSEYLYSWKDITSKNLISAFEYLNAAEEYEEIKAYAQEDMPESHKDGDIWLEISTGKLYQWDDSDDIWAEVNTEILPVLMNKIRTALKSTSDVSGKLDTELGKMNVRIDKVNEAISEITPTYIVDTVKESAIYKDAETGQTLMERMKSAESKITAESIVNTVTESTQYKDDLQSKASADELGNVKNELKEAKQEITADAIMNKVSKHTTYQTDLASKNKTFSQSEAPTSGMIEGDLWIDINDGNKLYRYDADTSQWRSIQDTQIDAAKKLAQEALDASGGGVLTYYGEETPTDPSEGNLWVRNATGVKGIWRYDGSQWVNLQDDVLYDAMQAAGDAKAIADKKILTFCQNDQPTSDMSVGDLWIDTNDNNKMYRYNGSSWIDVQDKHLDEEVSNVKSRLTSAEQKITDDAIVNTVKTQITYIDKLATTVSGVSVEYYLADPSYTPTGNESTGWSSKVTWSEGKYVWSRTVNTLTNGNKTHSTPTCISGSSEGLVVTSIEPQYCSYASETEAPPQDHEGWVSSSDTSGTESDTGVEMYTWSRSKITYSDGSVAYSDPYYDVSLNRLTDIEEHYSTQITQLSDSIESKVSYGDLDTMMKLELDGLHLKKSDSSNEVVIDEDSVDIRTGGTTYSSFGTGYVQFGNYTIREGKDGGLVFVYDKK